MFLVDRCSQFAWRSFHSAFEKGRCLWWQHDLQNVNICCLRVPSLTVNVNSLGFHIKKAVFTVCMVSVVVPKVIKAQLLLRTAFAAEIVDSRDPESGIQVSHLILWK